MPAYNYERASRHFFFLLNFFLKMLLADIWKMTDNQHILACLNCMLLLAFSLKQATWRSDLGISFVIAVNLKKKMKLNTKKHNRLNTYNGVYVNKVKLYYDYSYY